MTELSFDKLETVSGGQAVSKIIRYTIQPGDTIDYIAQRYGVTVDFLCEFNHLSNPHFLRAGDELLIPVFVE